MSYFRLSLSICFGVVLRLALRFSSYQTLIANRVEVSTPVNAWKRAIEGVTLLNAGISPYEGDSFHESPLFLHLYNVIMTHANHFIPFLFIFIDVLTALTLWLLSYKQLHFLSALEDERLKRLPGNSKQEQDTSQLCLITSDINEMAFRVATIYLLSPFSILSCVGQSTSIITTFILALTMYATVSGHRLFATACLSILAYQSFYPVMLIVPLMMAIEVRRSFLDEEQHEVLVDYSLTSTIISMFFTFSIFFLFLTSLLISSFYLMENDLSFISATYGFLWSVPDLTPTIGLFWYFFTEMFDHFRQFFLWTFQINAFIYVIPLAISLRKNPYLLNLTLLIILSLFKPYPSISDFNIYISLLPLWSHLFPFMKQGLIVSCVFISVSAVAPISWYLWIISETGNANYYFGVTLAYNTAQIFLVTDMLFAFTKREFYIDNGLVKDSKGKLAKLELSN